MKSVTGNLRLRFPRVSVPSNSPISRSLRRPFPTLNETCRNLYIYVMWKCKAVKLSVPLGSVFRAWSLVCIYVCTCVGMHMCVCMCVCVYM